MNNKIMDLNNHLFAQLERLNDESICGDDLEEELKRARAIAGVSSQIIACGQLALEAESFKRDTVGLKPSTPSFLEDRNNE